MNSDKGKNEKIMIFAKMFKQNALRKGDGLLIF